jgi:hypothetical protein
MNENNKADCKDISDSKILRSSPALPDFRAGALPARIFFVRFNLRVRIISLMVGKGSVESPG